MWFNFYRCRVYAISIYWSKLVIRKEIMYNFYKKASKTSSTLLSSNWIPFHLKRRHCKGTYCYLCKYKTIHLVFSVTCRLNYLSESPPPVHNTGSPHCRHKTLTGHVSLVSLNKLLWRRRQIKWTYLIGDSLHLSKEVISAWSQSVSQQQLTSHAFPVTSHQHRPKSKMKM